MSGDDKKGVTLIHNNASRHYDINADNLEELLSQCSQVNIRITKDLSIVNFKDQTNVTIAVYPLNGTKCFELEAMERNINLGKTLKTMIFCILNKLQR